MPALKEAGLWPAQITAIKNLEASLKDNRPRALIQMGERRVKESRTPAQVCAGWTTSAAGLRGEVTGSVISMVKIAVPLIVQSHETLAA